MAALCESFVISRAGSSFINGSYSLDKQSETTRYVRKCNHPLSNKQTYLEIIKTKIPQINTKDTFLVIQSRNLKNQRCIHYYVSPDNSMKWSPIAGIHPLPKLTVSPKQLKAMMSYDANANDKKHTSLESNAKQEIVTPPNTNANANSNESLQSIESTKRTFLENTYQFEHDSLVVFQGRDSKHGIFLVLNDTIFHTQGGGQPTDKGVITSKDGKTVVFDVAFVSNCVQSPNLVAHYGTYSSEKTFKINDECHQKINGKDRMLFAKLHTAGHVIDIGMGLISKQLDLSLKPTKGYHFAKGSYVEYEGNVDNEKRKLIKTNLQNVLDDFLNKEKELKTSIIWMDSDEYVRDFLKIANKEQQNEQKAKLKTNDQGKVRIISIPGFVNGDCMCGGTHVDSMSRFEKITISKFKKKNKNFRVSYTVQ